MCGLPLSPDCLIQKFKMVFAQLVRNKTIETDQIINYRKASDASLHSLLQFALIKAGIECGFIAVPEYKVQLTKAIDKKELDSRLRGKNKQWKLKADVAFMEKSEIRGLGEICTLDEIHGCQPSNKLREPWVTPHDKLLHLLNYSRDKINFLILVNIFPENFDVKIPWKDSKLHSIAEWKEMWKGFASALKALGTAIELVCISEKGVHVYPL